MEFFIGFKILFIMRPNLSSVLFLVCSGLRDVRSISGLYCDKESQSTRSPTSAQYNQAVLRILLKKQKTYFHLMLD